MHVFTRTNRCVEKSVYQPSGILYFWLSCLQCAIDTLYWTGFNHFVIWGSIAFYFMATFTLYWEAVGYYPYLGVARNVMSTANFWFTIILCVVVLLLPVVAERFYFIDTRPTLTDKVRLKQKITKSKSRSKDLVLRRASTLRRSTRSIGRSGYAFAHTEGFGRLITTGANMRGRAGLGDINFNRKQPQGANKLNGDRAPPKLTPEAPTVAQKHLMTVKPVDVTESSPL